MFSVRRYVEKICAIFFPIFVPNSSVGYMQFIYFYRFIYMYKCAWIHVLNIIILVFKSPMLKMYAGQYFSNMRYLNNNTNLSTQRTAHSAHSTNRTQPYLCRQCQANHMPWETIHFCYFFSFLFFSLFSLVVSYFFSFLYHFFLLKLVSAH